MSCRVENESVGQQRICVDCHTTRTPLWRRGPAGPRSLCNACGLRYRKRRKSLLGLHQTEVEKQSNENTSRSSINLNLGLVDLKEEEAAAVLLMALSSDCIPDQKHDRT